MTLGEFRKITEKLPDDAVFVDKRGIEKPYWVTVKREYARSSTLGRFEEVHNDIFLDDELCE